MSDTDLGTAAVGTPRWARGLLAFAFVVVSVEVFFSVPALGWSLVQGDAEIPVGVGLAGALLVLAGVLLLRRRALAVVRRGAARATAIPSRRWFLVLLLLGLAIRLAWVAAFPARATSDGATYLGLSHKILAGGPYESAGSRAYWPPGYPLFLAPWLCLGLPDRWAVALSNLALFAGMLAVVTALARRIAGESAARVTGLLAAFWPNLVTHTGVPLKEQLIVLLLPAALLLFHTNGLRSALLAGLVLGAATLVQPSLQLFFLVLLCYEVARRAPWRTTAFRILLVVGGMAIVIAPWSIRNQRVLGERVLFATNGGSNLYRANNPLATGGYEREGERSLESYDELTGDRLGYRWAREWIAEHPADFARLSVRKQVLLLGDDAAGAYETLRRGLERGGGLYVMLKVFSNAAWLLLWALILAAILAEREAAFSAPLAAALAMGFLYFYGIHSLFESAGRYHVPALGLLLTLAAALAVPASRAPAKPSLE